jgi:hypothetical protein
MRFLVEKLCKAVSIGFPYRPYHIHHKCIFIHIPKNAGTSVLNFLGDKGTERDHLNYLVYRKANSRLFNSYFKFSIVRNPLDRAYSIYNYLLDGGNGNADVKFKEMFPNDFKTFKHFIIDFLTAERMHSHNLFRPQYYYIIDPFGNLMIDKLFYYEELSHSMSELSDILHINSKFPEVNVRNKGKGYINYYDNEMIDRIYDLYNKDFCYFNYSI